MKPKNQQITLPAGAVITSGKGYRTKEKQVSIIEYRLNGETYVAWFPIGGGAA